MEHNDKENEYIATPEGQQYLKGFNDGYLMAEHMPEVVKALADVKEKTPHVEGFLDGAKQYEQDKSIGKAKSFMPEWYKEGGPESDAPEHGDKEKEQDRDKEL